MYSRQKWSENRPLLLFWHPLLCLLCQPSLYPFVFFSLSLSLLLTLLLLCLLQAWADAFRSIPDLTGVVQIYEELKRKGIEFPMSELETLSPIHTPQRVGGIILSSSNVYKSFCAKTTLSEIIFPGHLWHSVSVISRQLLLQRATPPYISTALLLLLLLLLSPHHRPSHQLTPLLRSLISIHLDPSIPHLNRYSVTPVNALKLPHICPHKQRKWLKH